MRAEDLEALRKDMLAVIAASAFALRDTIGKSAFDERVMTAMGKVPRHEFVPIEFQPYAYANIPLPIGFEKTISQPFVVALMTDLLDIKADDSVLEIGTGLGYQAAILAQLARKVYSVEIIEELGQKAKQRLRQQGCSNVELKIANGYHGWSEHAPFDKVIVTAAPDLIPPPLIHHLKSGGKMVIPAGLPDTQQLILVEKDRHGRVTTKEILPVRFSQLKGGNPPDTRQFLGDLAQTCQSGQRWRARFLLPRKAGFLRNSETIVRLRLRLESYEVARHVTKILQASSGQARRVARSEKHGAGSRLPRKMG